MSSLVHWDNFMVFIVVWSKSNRPPWTSAAFQHQIHVPSVRNAASTHYPGRRGIWQGLCRHLGQVVALSLEQSHRPLGYLHRVYNGKLLSCLECWGELTYWNGHREWALPHLNSLWMLMVGLSCRRAYLSWKEWVRSPFERQVSPRCGMEVQVQVRLTGYSTSAQL